MTEIRIKVDKIRKHQPAIGQIIDCKQAYLIKQIHVMGALDLLSRYCDDPKMSPILPMETMVRPASRNAVEQMFPEAGGIA